VELLAVDQIHLVQRESCPETPLENCLDSFVMASIEKDEEAQILLNQEGWKTLVGRDHRLWHCTARNGLAGLVHCLVGDVLWLTSIVAWENQRSVIVPSDLRLMIIHDDALCDKLGKTKVFYPPDKWED
jgi:hypothetical protein